MFLPIGDDNPHDTTPFVNYGIIAVCTAVFLWQLSLGEQGDEAATFVFGLIPGHLFGTVAPDPRLPYVPAWMTIFTSMFLHGGWMHVLGNMWFLYIFGDNIEDYLGHFKYLIFYLLSGLLAMSTQVAIYPQSNVPTVGASGAIAGVLGAYFLLYPRARVLTWFFVFVLYLPAWVVLGEWIVIQFFNGAAVLSMAPGRDIGGVAFWAHVGGFAAGAVMIKIFPQRSRRSPYAYQ